MAFGTKQRVEDPFVQVLSKVAIIQTNGLWHNIKGLGSICSGAFKRANVRKIMAFSPTDTVGDP